MQAAKLVCRRMHKADRCMYACMYVCMHACMYACIYLCVYVCTHCFMYVCMYVYVCMHACMYVRTCVCMYVCTSISHNGDTPRDLVEVFDQSLLRFATTRGHVWILADLLPHVELLQGRKQRCKHSLDDTWRLPCISFLGSIL